MAKNKSRTYLWQSRKRNALGLPWSFTKYSLDQERLYISRGLFTTTEDEIRLYRITDITLRRTLGQKMFRMGSIRCDSSDVTMQNFELKNIKHSKEVKDMLSKLVEESRLRNRVYPAENVTGRPQHPGPRPGGMEPPHQTIPNQEFDPTDANHNGVPDMYEK